MSDTTKFYLFNMTTGKKKLAYGNDPEDAFNILCLRLTKAELDVIIKTEFVRIAQRDLQKIVDQLG